jgi:hypothetical protein
MNTNEIFWNDTVDVDTYSAHFHHLLSHNGKDNEYNLSTFGLLANINRMGMDFTRLNIQYIPNYSNKRIGYHTYGVVYLDDALSDVKTFVKLMSAVETGKLVEKGDTLPPLFLFDPYVVNAESEVLVALRNYSGMKYEDGSSIEPNFDMSMRLRVKSNGRISKIHSGLRCSYDAAVDLENKLQLPDCVRRITQNGWIVHIGIDWSGKYFGLDFDIRENPALQYALTPFSNVLDIYVRYIKSRKQVLNQINAKNPTHRFDWSRLGVDAFTYDQVMWEILYSGGLKSAVVKEHDNKFKRRVQWYYNNIMNKEVNSNNLV